MSTRGRPAAQHRRGHSTGSMAVSKVKDEGLALFHEMQARERNNFLYPNLDDIEAALTATKFGGMSGYTSPPRNRLSSDLLGLGNEKNDYDWLLTPPGTPLFPSLDQPPIADADHNRSMARSKPGKITRGNSSPRRPASPARSLSSRGNSSPSRPLRPATPPNRPTTPGRSFAPTTRSLSASTSFNSTSSKSGTTSFRTARSPSPSRRTPVHPAMPTLSNERPLNLRTSVPDRPTSNPRGSSLSPRMGNHLKVSQNSDPGDLRGRSRRAVSPEISRSYNSSGRTSPSAAHEETSRIKPQTRKTLRSPGSTSFPSRKPFETSSKPVELRRATTSGFRPLMSNSHMSSFYTRTSKPLSSATDSSINSCSVNDEDEVVSKNLQGSNTQGQGSKIEVSRQQEDDVLQSVKSLLDSVIEEAMNLGVGGDSRSVHDKNETVCLEATEVVSIEKGPDPETENFCLLIDPKYSCSSMEVYQFDQELQSTGCEVDSVMREPLQETIPPQGKGCSKSTSEKGESLLNLSGDRVDEFRETRTRSCKRPLRDAPAAGFGSRHQSHFAKKKESRESNSSLFSIQINSSKGESISSGRPTSIDDTPSSLDTTPRRYPDFCRYRASEEDTKSEESCVDYYVVESTNKQTVGKQASRAQRRSYSSGADEEFVDYYIDEYRPQVPTKKLNSGDLTVSCDSTVVERFAEIVENTEDTNAVRKNQDNERADSCIEICTMEQSPSQSSNRTITAPTAEYDDMAECVEQLHEDVKEQPRDMDYEDEQRLDAQPMDCSPVEMQQQDRESDDSHAEGILICSSILHEIVFKAAALGIEKEDLQALATPTSTDELVTFLGLSKSNPDGSSTASTNSWKQLQQESSTTVRQYMHNQKMMQNTTVAYMQQGPLGRVQEDVKDHHVPDALDVEKNCSFPSPQRKPPKSNKCRCTIL